MTLKPKVVAAEVHHDGKIDSDQVQSLILKLSSDMHAMITSTRKMMQDMNNMITALEKDTEKKLVSKISQLIDKRINTET